MTTTTTTPKPALRHHLWKLAERFPETFCAPAEGCVALAKGAA